MQDPNWPPTALATLRAALTAPRLTAGLLAGGALGPLLEGLQANAEVRHAMKEPWLNELSVKHAAWISSTASGLAPMCDPVRACPQTASASQAILGSTLAALACLRRAATVAVAGSPSGGAAQPAPTGSGTVLATAGSDPLVAAIRAGLEAFDAARAAHSPDTRSAVGWLLKPR